MFVRKRDRITVIEKEKEAQKMKQMEIESKKMAEERRRQTLKVNCPCGLSRYSVHHDYTACR